MIQISIPDFGELSLEHLVLDYNGTLAVDGVLLDEVAAALRRLAPQLSIHVVTADTFGRAAAALEGLPCRLSILPPGAQDEAKRRYVAGLGAARVVAIGNGRNDRSMLAEAGLGVAVILREGAATATLQQADVVCTDILSALELLAEPRRLVATLRA